MDHPRQDRFRRARGLLCLALLGCLVLLRAETLLAAAEPEAGFLAEHGLRYWLVTRQEPRTLRLHHLQVDLTNARVELAAVLAADPDGAGPATARLEAPLDLARRAKALALVNANPWQSLPDAAGKRHSNWREGLPVEILGLAVAEGVVRSQPLDAHCSFWLDAQRAAHIGPPGGLGKVREGVAGFAQLLKDGKIVVPEGGPIHPRTALGLDATGKSLYLVVADGRQPGYSEGLALHELAAYLLELGCAHAVNLDGGGSSIMLLSNAEGKLRVVNDPSTKLLGVSMPRPIPVALAVVEKGK